jgi:putative transposase
MARPLRIELPGGLYHVTSRGDGREDIYFDVEDREAWLAVLANVCTRFNWICHAYCQMTNHYHLVVKTPKGNLSNGMRQLNGVYTQRINRSHGRVGHVFQGRFKAVLVEQDSYLLELARYVVLNPVRAGLVRDAAEWRWSSHRAMLGRDPRPIWLDTDWLLGQFGAQRRPAIAKYEEFVRAGAGQPTIWNALRNQIFLGGQSFVEKMQRHIAAPDDLKEVPRLQRRPMAKPLEHYARKGRAGMAEAYLSGDYTMQQIAAHFAVHYSTVSRAVRQSEKQRDGGVLDCKT